MFTQIIGKTLSLYLEFLETFLLTCHDSITVLILLRLVAQHNALMQRRRVHCLDAFFDRVNMLMWPKFKAIFDANLASIDKCVGQLRVSPAYIQPHYMIYRYAEYCAALSALNQGYDDAILSSCLQRLRVSVMRLLMSVTGRITTPKNQLIFLINNFMVLLRTLQVRGIDNDETTALTEATNERVTAFIEMELGSAFPQLIKFVVEMEGKEAVAKDAATDAASSSSAAAASAVAAASQPLYADRVASIIAHFNGTWIEAIKRMNGVMQQCFSQSRLVEDTEFKPANQILKQTLVQLVLYYQRFQVGSITHVASHNHTHSLFIYFFVLYLIR
jgi:hypothetical protein